MHNRRIARIDGISLAIGLISIALGVAALVQAGNHSGVTNAQVHLSFSNNCPSTEVNYDVSKGNLNWKLENTGSTSLLCQVMFKSKENGSYQQVYCDTLRKNTQTAWNFSQKFSSSGNRYYKISEVSGNLTAKVKPAEFYINVT